MLSGGLRTKGITKQSQENQPLITVITVVRNGEKTLAETILSVINQTYTNIEYIIIDGASTDGTLDIIKKHEDKIAYWISEPDKGIYDAMNKGIDLAMGEWINFMNSGDGFYLPTTLQDIFGKENSALKADIIYGDTLLVYDIGSYIQRAKPLENMLDFFPFGHQASFIKSKLMKEIKYNETYKSSGDYHFFYNCYLNKCSFVHIDVIVAVYNAQYGMSLNYKLVRLEDARIHGIEKTFRWNIKFSIDYTVYLIKSWLKGILPKNLVKKIRKRNMEKVITERSYE